MKIAIFTDFYLSNSLGGTETAVYNLAESLRGQGHRVVIFTPNYYKKNHQYTFDVEFLPSVYWLQVQNTTPLLPAVGVLKKIKTGKFDVIHVHTESQTAALGLNIARKLKIPSVRTSHTLVPLFLKHQKNRTLKAALLLGACKLVSPAIHFPHLDHRLAKYELYSWKVIVGLSNLADVTTSPSQHFATKLKKYGLNHPVFVVPNAVDVKKYKPAKINTGEELKLISVGRLSAEKRLDVLIRSLSQLKGADVKLQIVGGGKEMKKLKKLCSELGVDNMVVFTGSKSPNEVAKLLSQSDVFCLVSYQFDNQPVSILEALASGLPILYCDPDLKEGLTPNNAFLSKPDATSLAATIDDIYKHREKLKTMAEVSLAKSKQFSYEEQARKTVNIYKRLIAP